MEEINTESGIASTKKRGIMNGANLISIRKLIPVSADILDNLSICWVRKADIRIEMLRMKPMESSLKIYLSIIFILSLLVMIL